MSYNHRDRVLASLSHREPDRVPIDLGATRNSSITVDAYRRLIQWLKLDEEIDTKQLESARGLRLAQVDERILERLDVDLRSVFLGPPDSWQDINIDERTYQDEWGVIRHQPPSSFYYDIIQHPLAGSLTQDDIVSRQWPDPEDPGLYRGLRNRALRLRESTDYAVVLHLGNIIIHQSQYLRGFEDWFMDFAANPELICMLLDAILELRMATTKKALEEVGDLVDIVSVSDDLADQRGPILSPMMFRSYLKPRFRQYFDLIRSLSCAKILFHCCGSVYKLLPDFIDLGIDCINPVQVSAANMDTDRLKEEFGDELTFWGGIDTQHVLPYGTVEDVKLEVYKRMQDLALNGGYILSAVHNIQPDVPPENIWTMYETAKTAGHFLNFK